jgi:hypothetical protein
MNILDEEREIIAAQNLGDGQVTLISTEGEISCIRPSEDETGKTWLFEKYEMNISEVLEEGLKQEFPEDSLWDILAEGSMFTEEIDRPQQVYPEYELLTLLKEHRLIVGGKIFEAEKDIMRGPLVNHEFINMIRASAYEAEKEIEACEMEGESSHIFDEVQTKLSHLDAVIDFEGTAKTVEIQKAKDRIQEKIREISEPAQNIT